MIGHIPLQILTETFNSNTVELFRILFGIDRPGDDLRRDDESTLKAKAAGQGAHKLEKPPLADQMHVVIWVIKANDIRFEKGRYRDIIKYVQDQLREASKYSLTPVTPFKFRCDAQKSLSKTTE